jgi:hypothetical protein
VTKFQRGPDGVDAYLREAAAAAAAARAAIDGVDAIEAAARSIEAAARVGDQESVENWKEVVWALRGESPPPEAIEGFKIARPRTPPEPDDGLPPMPNSTPTTRRPAASAVSPSSASAPKPRLQSVAVASPSFVAPAARSPGSSSRRSSQMFSPTGGGAAPERDVRRAATPEFLRAARAAWDAQIAAAVAEEEAENEQLSAMESELVRTGAMAPNPLRLPSHMRVKSTEKTAKDVDALVERLKDTLHENGADVSLVRKSDFKYVLSSVEDAAAGGGKASAERVVGGSKNYFKSFGAAHARRDAERKRPDPMIVVLKMENHALLVYKGATARAADLFDVVVKYATPTPTPRSVGRSRGAKENANPFAPSFYGGSLSGSPSVAAETHLRYDASLAAFTGREKPRSAAVAGTGTGTGTGTGIPPPKIPLPAGGASASASSGHHKEKKRRSRSKQPSPRYA